MSLSAMNGIHRVGHVIGEPRRRRTADGEVSPPEDTHIATAAMRSRGRNQTRGVENGYEPQENAYYEETEPAPGRGRDRQPRERAARVPREQREPGVPRELGDRRRGGRPPKAEPASAWDAPPAETSHAFRPPSTADQGNVWGVSPVATVSIGDMIDAEKLRVQVDKLRALLAKSESLHAGLLERTAAAERESEAAQRKQRELQDSLRLKDSLIVAAAERERTLRAKLEQVLSASIVPLITSNSSMAKLEQLEVI
ncbi:hypothetical protein T492DRAFT_1083278 [Pavlovales sp. CCMP2436]|nr:hypothetical protein T492DRAFT_1083278 [Pavlovales sp. CCMP2436]